MAHLLVSAAHKSSGKTTVSIGLCAALARRGVAVQPFKKGPDYIDPMWLGAAAGRPCHNLDFFLQSSEEISATFAARAREADLGLVEGNKGLYDGLDLDGSNSNAALARLLHAPVILVLDARGMTRGIAPLILGYQAFDPAVNVAGVILNRLGGRRHESKLRAVIEHYTDVPVLGAIQADDSLVIPERHLGLVPNNEDGLARAHIDAMAEAVSRQVDLDRVLQVAATAPELRPARANDAPAPVTGNPVRLGIVRDAAFGFYYPADLEALERAGAHLVTIDSLHDQRLPEVDGLFIGGGFPEVHMQALEANTGLRAAIRQAVEDGLPVYAECGGLMYLARGIRWRDRHAAMAGALPLDVQMHDRPQGRGYVRLRETGHGPWPLDAPAGPAEFPAHEFHYSAIENAPADLTFAYEVLRGHGVDGRHDGIVYRNTLASYSHLRHVRGNPWTGRFVDFVRRQRDALRAPALAAKV